MKNKIPRYKDANLRAFADYFVFLAANIEDAYELAKVPITSKDCMEKAFELLKLNHSKVSGNYLGTTLDSGDLDPEILKTLLQQASQKEGSSE